MIICLLASLRDAWSIRTLSRTRKQSEQKGATKGSTAPSFVTAKKLLVPQNKYNEKIKPSMNIVLKTKSVQIQVL